MPERASFDVIILGSRGLRVLVLDQADFPSDTLSTHVVYGDSFGVWEEIGAWTRVRAIDCAPIPGSPAGSPEPG